jgi:NhaP-type Na+/H+ or K+/H+ antiporter
MFLALSLFENQHDIHQKEQKNHNGPITLLSIATAKHTLGTMLVLSLITKTKLGGPDAFNPDVMFLWFNN